MHIPPYHKKPYWQLFMAGCAIGGIIAYIVLLSMYGKMYEGLIEENVKQQAEINDLERQNEALLKDKEDLNEKANEPRVVESIVVQITNWDSLRLDRLIIHQLEELIKEEINYIVGRDVELISEMDELLISTIENKAFTVDDFTYYFQVEKLTIARKVKLSVFAELDGP